LKCLLQEKLKMLSDIDDQILELCSVDDFEREIEESAEVVVRILHAIKIIKGYTEGQGSSQSAMGNDGTPVQTINTLTASMNAISSVNVSDNLNTSNTSVANTSVANTSVANTSVANMSVANTM
jgi:hypothetical protein